MIKNIVFDFGGVFLDLSIPNCVKKFEDLGVYDAQEMLDPYKQNGLFLELESGHLNAEEFVQTLNSRYHLNLDYDDVNQSIRAIVVNVGEYKFDFLDEMELKKNYNVYLLSNTNPFIYSWANSDSFLKNGKRIEDFFHKTFCSYKMGVCKPEKKIFDMLLEDTKIDPTETLFVDDSLANIEMGTHLGFQTLMPKDGEDWRSTLMDKLK